MKKIFIFLSIFLLISACSKNEKSNVPEFLRNTEKYASQNIDKHTMNIPISENANSVVRRYVFSVKNSNTVFNCNLSSPSDSYRKVDCNGKMANKKYSLTLFPGEKGIIKEINSKEKVSTNFDKPYFPLLENNSKIFVDKINEKYLSDTGDINLSVTCVNSNNSFGCANSEQHGFAIENKNIEVF